MMLFSQNSFAHWVMVNTDSGDGLPPAQHQAIAWTNSDMLSM